MIEKDLPGEAYPTRTDAYWQKWDRQRAAECAADGHVFGNAGRCSCCGVLLHTGSRMRYEVRVP